MKSLRKYKLKSLELVNRIVMAPMCMYSSDERGEVKAFHKSHYGARAAGGVGLMILEATGVVPNGRISSKDLGIWNDQQIDGLKSIVDFAHTTNTKVGIQLAHAGRKSKSNDEYIVAPSAIRHSEEYRIPRELSVEEIRDLVDKFKEAAIRAEKAGFDTIEIHAAHGYLVHEFLSPVTNKRSDEYGGSLINRTRFLSEILKAIKTVWPVEKPIIVRVSASDYVKEGINVDEMVKIINETKHLFDLVHVSTGGLVNTTMDIYPGYQVSYSDAIKNRCDMPTIAVGLIDSFEQIEEILGNERADLVGMARELLRNPNFVMNMAYSQNIAIDYTEQYERAYRFRTRLK